MKRKTMTALAGLTLFFAGCVVTSVYPFYTEKDVVFDSALLGVWGKEGDAKESWKFQTLQANQYELLVREADKTNAFEVHLFKIKDQRFLDLFPRDRDWDCIPAHYLMKVDRIQPTLRMSGMNYKWLEELLQKHPRAIRHQKVLQNSTETNNYRIILTAESKDLQRFLTKHLSTQGAYEEPEELKRLDAKGAGESASAVRVSSGDVRQSPKL